MNLRTAVAVLVTATACAMPRANSVTDDGPRRLRDVITVTDLQRVSAVTAFDAIKQLRPEFLTFRRGGRPPAVYVDYIRVGGIETLREIPVTEVAEVRHLNSSDATTLFGTGNTDGAILILTGGRPD